LHKNKVQNGIAPGNPGNPELYGITFYNGILGHKPTPQDGKKRSAEYIYDPETGIRMYIHFFVGQSRGNDFRPSQKIGNLSVHLYVMGPETDKIKADIQKILNSIEDEYKKAHNQLLDHISKGSNTSL
jgi:hypothetical protein